MGDVENKIVQTCTKCGETMGVAALATKDKFGDRVLLCGECYEDWSKEMSKD